MPQYLYFFLLLLLSVLLEFLPNLKLYCHFYFHLGLTVPSKENAEQRKKVQYGSKKKNNKRLQTQTSEEAAKDNAIDEGW